MSWTKITPSATSYTPIHVVATSFDKIAKKSTTFSSIAKISTIYSGIDVPSVVWDQPFGIYPLAIPQYWADANFSWGTVNSNWED
tara:strand:- start:1286 stop:1540 length:255 start_codon:yes stop_codon:yes gene_type:complete